MLFFQEALFVHQTHYFPCLFFARTNNIFPGRHTSSSNTLIKWKENYFGTSTILKKRVYKLLPGLAIIFSEKNYPIRERNNSQTDSCKRKSLCVIENPQLTTQSLAFFHDFPLHCGAFCVLRVIWAHSLIQDHTIPWYSVVTMV